MCILTISLKHTPISSVSFLKFLLYSLRIYLIQHLVVTEAKQNRINEFLTNFLLRIVSKRYQTEATKFQRFLQVGTMNVNTQSSRAKFTRKDYNKC